MRVEFIVAMVTGLHLLLLEAYHSAAFKIEMPLEIEDTLTCYTCPEMATNGHCNRWAPEKYCPKHHTVCKTVHKLDTRTGESVAVAKTCARPEHCSPEHVGCHATNNPNLMKCISCCGDSYCNKEVPTNQSTAALLSLSASSLESSTAASRHVCWPIVFLSLITWLV